MKKIAIVILNWNGQKFLKQFLPTVVKHSSFDDTEIYVADNGSSDDSLSFLKNYPSVKVIAFEKNHGFTTGYNKALSQIKAKYYVLLNSDIEVTPNWLQPIVNFLDNNLEVAAAMPKILDYNKKTHFEYAGAAGGFLDKFAYPFCRGRILDKIEEDKGQYNQVSEIFWATGACLFIRADLFHQLGGLDDDFFAHMEEIDLCWRLKNEGYKIMYIPQSFIYHVGGGTLPNNNPKKIFLNYRNNLFLILKNIPQKKLFKILFTRMVLDGVSSIVYIFQGKFAFFLAVLKAHFAFYTSFKRIKKKRKHTNTCTKISGIYNKSIVFDYFINKKKNFSDLELMN